MNTDNYLSPFSKDLFRLLANCFLLLRYVLIFLTLLVDFQILNRESVEGPWTGDTKLFNPLTLYSVLL